MPRKSQRRTSPTPAPDAPRPAPAADATVPGGLTADQVARWAELISDGRDAFPSNLPQPDHDRLLAEVRCRLRTRLVHFIARAIAAQLQREAGPDAKV